MNEPNWQPGMTLAELEKRAILKAFRYCGGVQTKTAAALGITTRTLYNKLTSYGLKGIEDDSGKDGVGEEKGTQSKDAEAPGVPARTGLRMEPASQTPSQHAVPVRKREEVQEVPSSRHAGGSSKKGR